MNFIDAKQEATKVLTDLTAEHYRTVWGKENRISPVRSPKTLEERAYELAWGRLVQFASPVEAIDSSYGGKGYWGIEYALDETKVARLAQNSAEMAVESWGEKLEKKIGASLLAVGNFNVSLSGEFRFEGMREADKIVVTQKSVHGWSCLGTSYWTFPARIYVNGKFQTEDAFNGREKAPKTPKLSTHVVFEDGGIMRRKDYEKMLASAIARGKTLRPVSPFSLRK